MNMFIVTSYHYGNNILCSKVYDFKCLVWGQVHSFTQKRGNFRTPKNRNIRLLRSRRKISRFATDGPQKKIHQRSFLFFLLFCHEIRN